MTDSSIAKLRQGETVRDNQGRLWTCVHSAFIPFPTHNCNAQVTVSRGTHVRVLTCNNVDFTLLPKVSA